MNVERRDVLRGLGLLAVAAGAVGCTEPPKDPPPDPLADLAARASADAATADAVAATVPALAASAGMVAEARREHGTALRAEIDRVRPPVRSSTSAPPPSGERPPADAGAARTLLLDALTSAERQAGELVASLPRHRAGLVGSVTAGCASLREVVA